MYELYQKIDNFLYVIVQNIEKGTKIKEVKGLSSEKAITSFFPDHITIAGSLFQALPVEDGDFAATVADQAAVL